jgi:tetratricopeptide (TPR) repeat protein
MIENWLGNDPNHWASLLWAQEFFEKDTYIQYLKGATRNAIKQNELGNIYVEKGKYKRSLKYYQKALDIDEHPIYACNLGRSHGHLNDWNQMIMHCGHAVKLHKQATSDPNQLDYYYNYLADGYCNADRLDEFDQLIEETEEFKNEPVKRAYIYNRIGNYFFEKNKNEDAVAYYRKAIENNSQKPVYACSLGRAYGNLGKLDEMIQHCTNAVELRREAPSDGYGLDYYYDFLSEGYYKANRLPEFEDLFKNTIDFIDASEKKAIVYNRIGNLLANDTQNKDAISYYQKAIQLDPQKPIYHCNIGITYGKLEEWNDMIIHCEQAIERRRITPDDAYGLDYYYNFLAEGYYNAGRLPEFEDFLKIANDFRDKPQEIGTIYNWIGIMLFGDGKNDEAIACYKKGIAYDNQKPIFECNLGQAYGNLENWDKMIHHCTRAVELRSMVARDSYELDYYYDYLAEGYVQAGKETEFDRILEETEDLNSVPDKKATIYNQMGNYFFDKDKNEKAVTYYQKANEHNHQKPIYECNLGRAYGKLAKWKEMIHHCTRAIELRRDAVSDTYGLDYYYDFLSEGYYKANQIQAFEHIFDKTDDFDNTPEKKATVYNRIGNLLANEAQNSEAILYYQKAIGLDPQKPIYLCNIGITYGKLNQWDEMIDHCRKAIELRKTTSGDAYGLDYYYNVLAEAYFKADRLPEFEDLLESSQDFRDKPEEIGTVYNRIANLFFDKGKDTEAITFYKKAIAYDSQRPIYQCNLGRTYGNLENWDEMIRHCTTAIEMRGNAATDDYELDYYYQYLAEGYVKADKQAEFDRLFEKTEDLISVPNQKALVYNRMANLLFDKSKDKDAITYYQKAIVHDSQNPIFECNLGRTYGKLENWDEMIQHCEKAVALRNNATTDAYKLDYYYEYLADGYFKANRLDELNRVLEETEYFKTQPLKKAHIYNHIGNQLANASRDNDALFYYQQAVQFDPQKPIYIGNMGIIYGKLKQWDEMIDHCKQAIELRKSTPDDAYSLDYYYSNLAEAYISSDRLSEFEGLLESTGDFRDKPETIGAIYNRIANWFSDKIKDAEAITFYKKAITYDSQKPIYECNLGRTYGNLGNWDEMIQHCERAVELRKKAASDSYELDYYFGYLEEGYLRAGKIAVQKDKMQEPS